jgi:hypothetical protein
MARKTSTSPRPKSINEMAKRAAKKYVSKRTASPKRRK